MIIQNLTFVIQVGGGGLINWSRKLALHPTTKRMNLYDNKKRLNLNWIMIIFYTTSHSDSRNKWNEQINLTIDTQVGGGKLNCPR